LSKSDDNKKADAKEEVRLLFIADSKKPLISTFNFLRKRGWNTFFGTSLKDALAIITNDAPNFVLISWNIQSLNPAKSEKMIAATFNIPVIVFTEKVLDGRQQSQISHSGIKEYMLTPVSGPSTHMKIRKMLMAKNFSGSEVVGKRYGIGTKKKIKDDRITIKSKPDELPKDGKWEEVGESDDGTPIWMLKTNRRQVNKEGRSGSYVFKGRQPPEQDENGKWNTPSDGELGFTENSQELLQSNGESDSESGDSYFNEQNKTLSDDSDSESESVRGQEAEGDGARSFKSGKEEDSFDGAFGDSSFQGEGVAKKTFGQEEGDVEGEISFKNNSSDAEEKESAHRSLRPGANGEILGSRKSSYGKGEDEEGVDSNYEDVPEGLTDQDDVLSALGLEEGSADSNRKKGSERKKKKSNLKIKNYDEESVDPTYHSQDVEDDASNLRTNAQDSLASTDSRRAPFGHLGSREDGARSSRSEDLPLPEGLGSEDEGVDGELEASVPGTDEQSQAVTVNKKDAESLALLGSEGEENMRASSLEELPEGLSDELEDALLEKAFKSEEESDEALEAEGALGQERALQDSAVGEDAGAVAIPEELPDGLTEEKADATGASETLQGVGDAESEGLGESKDKANGQFAAVQEPAGSDMIVRNKTKVSGKKTDTLLALSTVKALENIVQHDGSNVEPLGFISKIDCVPINSERFKGILIFASSVKDALGAEFSRTTKFQIINLMQEGGEVLKDEGELELDISNVNFIQMCGEFAEFLTVTKHNGNEVGVAYIQSEGVFPSSLTSNSSGMVSVGVESLEPGANINFDAYIHLSKNEKYLKYLKKGGRLEEKQKQRLEKYNVKHFFIKENQVQEFKSHCASAFVERIVKQLASMVKAAA